MKKIKLGTSILIAILLYGFIFFSFSGDIDLSKRLLSPSLSAPFGYDSLGRNLFYLVSEGVLVSISISMSVVVVSTLLGLVIAYFMAKKGFLSNIFTILSDTFKVIPPAILALFLASISGSGSLKLILALSIASCSNIARTLYTKIKVINEDEYVKISRSYGKSGFAIFRTHVVVQLWPYMREQGISQMLSSMLTESALSYLGCGVGVSTVSLGSILSNSRSVSLSHPHAIVFPAMFLLLLASAFVLISKGLEERRRNRFF